MLAVEVVLHVALVHAMHKRDVGALVLRLLPEILLNDFRDLQVLSKVLVRNDFGAKNTPVAFVGDVRSRRAVGVLLRNRSQHHRDWSALARSCVVEKVGKIRRTFSESA